MQCCRLAHDRLRGRRRWPRRGANRRPPARLRQVRHHPDLEAYRHGRSEGLREFCQSNNGYRAGVTGAAYHDVCPADLAAPFLAQYHVGHERYVHEQRVRDADVQLTAKRAEIARLDDGLARSGLQAIKETSTLEQRAHALLDARQYAERIGQPQAETAQLEKDRMLYSQELAANRAAVALSN